MPKASLLRIATLAAGAALLGAACHGPSYPAADCHQAIWAAAGEGVAVTVLGSWDGWQAPVAAQPTGYAGWQLALLDLPAGEYGYQVVTDGVVGLDPSQPLTTFRGEQEVSLLVVQDCHVPSVQVQEASATAEGALSVKGSFLAAADGPALDPASVRVTIDGAAAAGAKIDATPASGAFSIAAQGLAPGKHTVTVSAAGAGGAAAPDARAAVWVKPAAETWEDAVLYQIVTDRFRGDGGAALAPPPSPGARAGGTLSGIMAEIERGTFDALGVTALWISPLYTNPTGFFDDMNGHPSEGYHGYWPLQDQEVEPRIGGEAEVDALIAAAHARGLRVLFDLVPHHVFDQNPRYLAHEHDGWFDHGRDACVCGAPGCSWGTYLATCWFAPYLPSARFQDDAVMHAAMGDALFWMSRFDADGVRIDAVPMVPRAATRRVLRALRDSEAPAGALFSVGEIFTGGGEPGLDQIKYYLGPDGLDSAFDFPLMWAMRGTLADGTAGFDAIETILSDTEHGLAGSGSLPARMLDNHDTSRFVSEADGNGASDPWASPPPQPTNPATYARQRMALGLVFALPGVPVVYYGDEVALAGANDPDSRRVMPALDALSPDQSATLALTKRLGALRRCSKALRHGKRVPIWADATTYAFARDAGDGAPALALFSTATAPASVSIPGGIVPPGPWVDVVTGASFTLQGETTIPMDPLSFRILVSASSPCRP